MGLFYPSFYFQQLISLRLSYLDSPPGHMNTLKPCFLSFFILSSKTFKYSPWNNLFVPIQREKKTMNLRSRGGWILKKIYTPQHISPEWLTHQQAGKLHQWTAAGRRIFQAKQIRFKLISTTLKGGEEGQPHQIPVRGTFASFSRPSHLEILVIMRFKVSNSWR